MTDFRYIPGDFDAYDAFDDAGNPPVHLWTRHLRVNVPINWFSIFEEARRKQRDWVTAQNQEPYYYPAQEEVNGHPPAADVARAKSVQNGHKNDEGQDVDNGDKEKPAKKEEESAAASVAEQEQNEQQEGKDKDNSSANGDNKAPSANSSETDAKEPVTPAAMDNDAHPVGSSNSSHVGNGGSFNVKEAASTPIPKLLQVKEEPRFFSADNIDFAHNGEQFSIQSSGYQQASPLDTPTPSPRNGQTKKDAADTANNAFKTKRRSVHDLFRGSR